ncbi:MAG: hypothetical protein AAGU18_10935 [Proteiniphilum sp.]
MSKQSFTHYYVQAQEVGLPEIVSHTYDKKTKEHFYKFLDRKKAQALLEAEKKATPNVKFRVLKCTETYDAGSWF